MTTETKVGLVVGLAFILVFAMILSNRGSDSGLTAPSLDLTEAKETLDKVGATDRLAAGGPGAANQLAQPDDATSPLPNRPSAGAGQPVGDLLAGETSPADEEPTQPSPHVASPSAAEHQPASEGKPPSRRQAKEEDHFAPPPLPDAGQREPVVATGQKPAPPPQPPATREYEIKPHDTLSRIAQRFYGSDEPGVIRALCEANRGRISSPDHIVVGRSILIPSIRELVSGRPDASERATATATPAADDAVQLYVVKRGDTLMSIARRQLGQAARWREIRDLNRARLPDPDRLLVGAELRLPPPALASARRTQR